MTFLIIVLGIFLAVWFFDSSNKKKAELGYKKRTITNVKRQDELWCENFSKVMSDLEEISKTIVVDSYSIMPVIESLYEKYDIPDMREESEKISARQYHLSLYKDACKTIADNYKSACIFAELLHEEPPKEFKPGLYDYIWYSPWTPPKIDKPELLFGEPNTSITVDGFEYKYDNYGWADVFNSPPSKLIDDICFLLTKRALDKENLNYSGDRKESLWQQSDAKIKEYEKNKKNYPWLFK